MVPQRVRSAGFGVVAVKRQPYAGEAAEGVAQGPVVLTARSVAAAIARAAEAIGAEALVGLRELPGGWAHGGPLDRR